MDNTEKRYTINTDIVTIIPWICPETGRCSNITYITPITSPLHPCYKEPPHDFGKSIL